MTMPSKNFPGPSYNSLIENDSQIVKVPPDYFGWGARSSIMPSGGDQRGNDSAAPGAKEMTVKHVSGG
jgi:hypothetical protein